METSLLDRHSYIQRVNSTYNYGVLCEHVTEWWLSRYSQLDSFYFLLFFPSIFTLNVFSRLHSHLASPHRLIDRVCLLNMRAIISGLISSIILFNWHLHWPSASFFHDCAQVHRVPIQPERPLSTAQLTNSSEGSYEQSSLNDRSPGFFNPVRPLRDILPATEAPVGSDRICILCGACSNHQDSQRAIRRRFRALDRLDSACNFWVFGRELTTIRAWY